MNNKERIKQKQLAKKQAKEEKEIIINGYMSKIKNILDDNYLETAVVIEKFKEDLINVSVAYDNIKREMMIIFNKTGNVEDLEEVAQKAADLEENCRLYLTAYSKDENVIYKLLKATSDKVKKELEKAIKELQGKKNDNYLITLLINRCQKQLDAYNEYILDIALESDEYIETCLTARESFIDYVIEIKDKTDLILFEYNEAINNLNNEIKYKERLRVNYHELESFLIYKEYKRVRQTSTTHAIWKHKETGNSIPLPNKSGTVPQGTVSKVLRLINSSRQELAQFVYK